MYVHIYTVTLHTPSPVTHIEAHYAAGVTDICTPVATDVHCDVQQFFFPLTVLTICSTSSRVCASGSSGGVLFLFGTGGWGSRIPSFSL
jgi:hypothetical protein